MTTIGYAITTWNRHLYLDYLLKSLDLQSTPANRVVIVDNLSTDAFLKELLQKASGNGIQVLYPAQYVGLDVARNIGLRAIADCDVQFISEDAVFLAPNCIRNMVQFLTDHQEIGIVGPQHQAGVPHQNIRWGMKEFDLQLCDKPVPEDIDVTINRMENVEGMQLGTGCLAPMVEGHLRGFSKRMIDQIGLPDEGYEKGWNVDTDYCALARHHGFHTAVVFRSLIWHYRDLFYPLSDKEGWRVKGIQHTIKKYGSLENFDRYISEGYVERNYE